MKRENIMAMADSAELTPYEKFLRLPIRKNGGLLADENVIIKEG